MKRVFIYLLVLSCLLLTGCDFLHTHRYDTDRYVCDEEFHWHEAICGHADAVKDKGEHALDSDGVCTVCGFKSDNDVTDKNDTEHTHTFDTDTYEYDNVYHWHPANCEHTDEVSSKEEHTFNDDGSCWYCEYIDRTGDLPDVGQIVTASNGLELGVGLSRL